MVNIKAMDIWNRIDFLFFCLFQNKEISKKASVILSPRNKQYHLLSTIRVCIYIFTYFLKKMMSYGYFALCIYHENFHENKYIYITYNAHNNAYFNQYIIMYIIYYYVYYYSLIYLINPSLMYFL